MGLVDDRLNHEYLEGVEKFIDYAFSKLDGVQVIRCPCIKCCNTYSLPRHIVSSHLKAYEILRSYTFWYHHGEVLAEQENDIEVDEYDSQEFNGEGYNGMQDLMEDLFPQCNTPGGDEATHESTDQGPEEEPNTDAAKFYALLDKYNQPLYEGSRTSKLSALVNLLHVKNLGKWSNKSFTALLELLRKDFLPHDSTLPNSYYEAKKTIRELGLSYIKIDACKNDCMLYWKEDIDAESCKVCGSSRWKEEKHTGEIKHSSAGKKIPHKTMRYFPIKPRLQRLFMCRKTAAYAKWHKECRVDDGVMRHPADSKAWKEFDKIHSSFASEPRNVRLCLASDGFQPFANMRTSYSIWPVFLVPLNLPPWMCMKQQNVMLSMLLPGPDGPGDAIDVYLQPLIEELIELWEDGVDTYDSSTKTNFKLRAALLWTVHDFPAYGNISGHSTKGKLACPVCHKETNSMWLKKGRKFCYMGHRRFLRRSHRWRNDRTSFDGTKESRGPPKELSGDDVLKQVQDLQGIILSKDMSKKTKVSRSDRGDNWKKRSIFFELPYFKTLLLRHNLDVMHIEKNICDSIIGTLMNVKGKTKDNINTRSDLKLMNLRPDLHPVDDGGKVVLPPAPYTLFPDQKKALLSFFKELKVPDGFSSNISRCVNMKERKMSGLKSHDCHVILNHILPLALRGLLPENIYEPLVELSQFFKKLNSKALSVEQLEEMDAQIPVILCKLEKEFPPSFFDVMMHLPVHLAREALIGGPTIYRWMYLFERQIHCLKSLVRNMARPEGSIAEGYIADEFMTLSSRYLDDVETKHNRPGRIHDTSIGNKFNLSIFSCAGRPIGSRKTRDLDMLESEQAHIYILRNCDEVQAYIRYPLIKMALIYVMFLTIHFTSLCNF